MSGTKSIQYSGGQTIITTFNMNTGAIKWTIEGTSSVTTYNFSKLTSGPWNFAIVSYGAKVELIGGGPAAVQPSWGRMHSSVTKEANNTLNAPSGYHSMVLAPTYKGGSGEHTVKIKFVSGNTILIGFAKNYMDMNLSDQPDTCFYRSNGSTMY